MKIRLIAGAALGAALALAWPAAAQDDAADAGDPVVATVNGQEIYQSEVILAAQSLPPQYQGQINMLFPLLVERLIDMRLLSIAAQDAGLADDDEVKERLEAQKLDVMREVFLERRIDELVTDERVKERYDTFVADNPPEPEVNARHILLETEEDARAVISELDGGADFAELAKERSTGPSSAQGGDLGYFSKEQMVPEFSEAAFALEAGSHSTDPVQTQFGWHVIKVEDRRTPEPPTFEEMQEQMQGEVTREVVAEMVEGLRASADIELVTPSEEAPQDSGEAGAAPEDATEEDAAQ